MKDSTYIGLEIIASANEKADDCNFGCSFASDSCIHDGVCGSQCVCCIYCKGINYIKHGKTSTGNTRFRCKDCQKTWIDKASQYHKPEKHLIAEDYLRGESLRALVKKYQSSPLRLNQKIRTFLSALPRWEKYLDEAVPNITSKLILLSGKSFSCTSDSQNETNQMYVAFAIDAVSSMVVSFEIGYESDLNVWNRLLKRLKKRNIVPENFMSIGSSEILTAVESQYAGVPHRLSLHKVEREKEISCTLKSTNFSKVLVNEAVSNYKLLDNQTLGKYLSSEFKMELYQCLSNNYSDFAECVNTNCSRNSKNRIDNLVDDFKKRFEKFHSLKEDPTPLVNAWIAHKMLEKTEMGFSRMELFAQTPLEADFGNYTKNILPIKIDLKDNLKQLNKFVCQMSARIVQIPMRFDRQ